jgi:uncharacterized protein YcfJ
MSIVRALLVFISVPLLIPLAGCKEELVSIDQPCARCGVVESIVAREVKGDARGGGAVAGAIIGGVIGHQFGSGSGNDAATAAGAVGGAVAGHQVEKEMNKQLVYEVTVRMEKDGLRRLLTFDTPPPLREGDKVEVTGNQIERV